RQGRQEKKREKKERKKSIALLRRANNSFDAFFQDSYVEVDEQAQMESRRFQVGNHLSLKYIGQLIDGLQFNDKYTIDKKIEAAISDRMALVGDTDGPLTLEQNPLQFQLHLRGSLINALQVSRPKVAMHFYGRTDHGMGQLIQPLLRLPPLQLIHFCLSF